MKKIKVVICTNIAAPYEVKYEKYLSKHFDIHYLYHSKIGIWRPQYWNLILPKSFKRVCGPVIRIGSRHLSFGLLFDLSKFKPDIIIADDFLNPSSFLCMIWAKFYGVKCYIKSETIRNSNAYLLQNSFKVRIINFIYVWLDGVFAVSDDAKNQICSILPRFKQNIHIMQGPIDIEAHLLHSKRDFKKGATLLFANSLTKNYGALMALKILQKVHLKSPSTKLSMNGVGPLREECETFIIKNKLSKFVKFTDYVKEWDSLHKVYEESDILILPATHSNGNASVIEAMASGMGIVVSNSIVYSSDFVKKNSGFVVEASVNDFSRAIIKYIENPEILFDNISSNRAAVEHRRFKPCALRFKNAVYKSLGY